MQPRSRLAGPTRWVLAAAVLVVLVAAFLVFRPDRAVVDQRVDDTLPTEVSDALAPTSGSTDSTSETATTGGTATTAPPAEGQAPPATPTSSTPATRLLASGSFTGQASHSVTGRAAVVDTDQGRLLVLEELDSDNGPDLQLYLSPHAHGSVDSAVLVEPLRGNQGTQLYRLPDGVDLAATPNVVIWCERFSTPFGTATLG